MGIWGREWKRARLKINRPRDASRTFETIRRSIDGGQEYGLDPEIVDRIAAEVRTVANLNIEICLVIGGGNIFRGVSGAAKGMDRASAIMGMLATVINALAMQNALERNGVDTRVLSAIPMQSVCEPYIRGEPLGIWSGAGLSYLPPARAIFFDGYSSGARARRWLRCVARATKVDRVYTEDPVESERGAIRTLSYHQVLSRDLRVMDVGNFIGTREQHTHCRILDIR